MTYETYDPGRRSKTQDGPSWWETTGKNMVAVVAVGLFVIAVFGLTAAAVSSRSDKWDEWCVSQGGAVERWSQTPPDQRVNSGDDRYFCLVDGRAVGSR